MQTTKNATHQQMLRMKKVLAFLRENNRVTQAEMASAAECSKKTIQRAIDSLRADGWPIEHDKKGHYLSPQYMTDLRASKNSQIATLMLAGCAIDKHLLRHFPSLALVIRESLLDRPDLQSLTYDIQQDKIAPDEYPFSIEQLDTFGAIARNIIEEIAISFTYRAATSPSGIMRRVYPIKLKQSDGVWYLVAFDLERKAIRVFSMFKMKNVKSCMSTYDKPPGEAIKQGILLGEFSIWDTGDDGGDAFHIKIKLSDHAADFIRHNIIHHTQNVEELDLHTVILHLQTSDLTGVKHWMRKFLHLAVVIEPKELKEQHLSDLQQAISRQV